MFTQECPIYNHSECNVASSLAADCPTLKLLQNFTNSGSESAEELCAD